MAPDEFIKAIGNAAKQSTQQTKIPASFTIAEAALESGWGNHCPGMNLFGIKADSSWEGDVTIQRTRELVCGHPVMIDAKFRAYPDWLGSIKDHACFLLGNDRYLAAFQYTDGCDFAQAIADAGYATDPNYAKTIIQIIKQHNLIIFDN